MWIDRKRLKKTWLWTRIRQVRFKRWWLKNDRHYGLWWRLANGATAVLILASVIIPVAQQLSNADCYKLSADALNLVGNTDQTLSKQLTYDSSTATYQFNKDAIKGDSSNPLASQQSQVGTASGAGTDKSLYALDVPQDISKGVTYHDINSQLSFSLVPQFKSSPGKEVDGHLVFPLTGDNQAIYTLKNNGLKEDIVVPKAAQDTMTFGYTLNLPKTLEAKVIPGSDGNIGIYSADPALFGSISYGSSKDQAAVEKARENGAKTNLVFGLPSPVIKAADGASVGSSSARFQLTGDQLSVIASGLTSVKTPLTIDPSVVVTSTSDFQTGGNNEGMIDFSTSGQINRGGLTGGSANSFSTGASFSLGRFGHASVAYNGYLYVIGGCTAGSALTTCTNYTNTIQYASISSGAVGSFSAGSAFTTARYGLAAVAYNGYLYVMGGNNGSDRADVQYAAINSGTGALGTFASTTSFTTARRFLSATVSNGNLYMMGGYDGSTYYSDVQYAPVKGDGTVGSWTSTTSFTTGRFGFQALTYNNYLYVLGGCSAGTCSTYKNDVQYAPLNANGTVGSWASTTSFTTARFFSGATVYNGYLYLLGGYSGSYQADVQYAPLNANGTVGSWAASINYTAPARGGLGAAAYNGYLYFTGGYSGSVLGSVGYSKIDPAGQAHFWAVDSTHTINAARAEVCSVAYNGYLYAIGGSTTDTNVNNVTTVEYSPIAADGTLGAWSTTTSLPLNRGNAGCAASNGFLYTVGGVSAVGSGAGTADGVVMYIAINSGGTLGASWTAGNSMTAINAAFLPIRPGVFVYDGNIYSVGGQGSGNHVFSAPLNVTTGAVGVWVQSSNNIPTTHNIGGYALAGKYLYALGGSVSGTAQSTVQFAQITGGGAVGSWTTTGSLPTAIGFNNATTINGCIYSVGGENGAGTSQNPVYYGCPASDGSLSATTTDPSGWHTAPTLTTATTDIGVTSYNGQIYGVGGFTTSSVSSTLFSAVNNGGSGTAGSWTTGGNSFTTARALNSTATYNNYLYVAGGVSNGGTILGDVQYTQLNGTGGNGSFTTDTHSLPSARDDFGMVAYNGYLYAIGGDQNGSKLNDVEYAPIGSSGALTANFTAGNNFDTNGRSGACTVAYNGFMYVGGGWDSTTDHTDFRYAPINGTGSVGTWNDSGHNYTTGRSELRCLVAGGYMYILGGNGSGNYNDVQAALVCTGSNSGTGGCSSTAGTLGTFAATTSFNTPRGNFGVSTYDGFIYIVGGCTDANADCSHASVEQGDLQYASVNANGTLGAWQILSLSAANGAGSTQAVNGYLYLLGGDNSSDTGLATVQSTPLSSIARVGYYSKLIDLSGSVNVTGIAYNGILPTGAAAMTYRAAGSSGVFGSSAPVNTVSGSGSCTGNLTATRYVWINVTLDDSTGVGVGGAFPDIAGATANTNAHLSDFTINYNPVHPAPNIRLRAGQTLQAGNLSALDTCFP